MFKTCLFFLLIAKSGGKNRVKKGHGSFHAAMQVNRAPWVLELSFGHIINHKIVQFLWRDFFFILFCLGGCNTTFIAASKTAFTCYKPENIPTTYPSGVKNTHQKKLEEEKIDSFFWLVVFLSCTLHMPKPRFASLVAHPETSCKNKLCELFAHKNAPNIYTVPAFQRLFKTRFMSLNQKGYMFNRF